MRAVLFFALFLCGFVLEALAGLIPSWTLAQLVKEPDLVVGRVITVQRDAPLPGPLPGVIGATAEVEVLRRFAFNETQTPEPGRRLQLRFSTYGGGGLVNGPMLVALEPGKVYVLPIRPQTESGTWRLWVENGYSVVIPVRGTLPGSEPTASTGLEVALSEIANSLARGTPSDIAGTADYVGFQANLTEELMPLLESSVGNDQNRWLEIAAGLLTGPRAGSVSISEAWPGTAPAKSLIQAVLGKVPRSPTTESMLITRILNAEPTQLSGPAMVLPQFKDSPTTIEGVRDALRRDADGSAFMAMHLVRSGQAAVVDDALARSLRVVNRPRDFPSDVMASIILLVNYGSESQLDDFSALIRRHRTANPESYNLLSRYIGGLGNPREGRILAPFLMDSRTLDDGHTRYSDSAVWRLQEATKDNFGAESARGGTIEERDAAVARAIAWLDAHGIPHEESISR